MSSEIIFSVPLIRYKIENWDIAKKEIKNALPNFTENLLIEDIYTDYFDQNENLPSYSDTVLKIIEPYLRLLSQNSCVYITDMWFQTALKGMKHTCHNHGLGWSAIIYIDFDEQKHIATKFYSPFNDPFNNLPDKTMAEPTNNFTFNATNNNELRVSGDVIAFHQSDKRLKNNIKPISNPLDKILKIGGYTFDWSEKQNMYEGQDVGVIAQEIEKVLPEVVEKKG